MNMARAGAMRSDASSATASAAQTRRGVRYRRIDGLLYTLAVIGEFFVTFARGLVPGRWRRTMRAEFTRFLFQVGVRAVPAVSVTAVLVGVGLVLQITYWSSVAGITEKIGDFLVLVLVRQAAPIITALVLIGRSGSVLVDEVGHLATSGQLRTLRSHGIDPMDLITTPRAWAMGIATLLLTILFIHIALWTGFLSASLSGMVRQPTLELLHAVFASMSPRDHLLLVIKPLLIGYVVAYVSIWLGMRVRPGVGGVRRVLPTAFVSALLATFIIGTGVSAIL